MDPSLMVAALKLAIHLSIPLLAAIICGAVLMGVLRVVTQIDDQVLAYVGKLGGLVCFLYLSGGAVFNELFLFAQRIWGGGDFFY